MEYSIETANPTEIVEYLESLIDKAYSAESVDSRSFLCEPDYECPVWKKLYDFVFSDEISRKISERFPSFQMCFPDTTYGEDVRAYIREFSEYVQNIKSYEDNSFFQDFESWTKSRN